MNNDKDSQNELDGTVEELQKIDSAANQPSLGSQLKAARDKARLSIGEVSKELLITKARLTALESDDHSQLPAKVFVVGYLKKYAALVNLDEDALLKQYEAYCSTVDPVEESSFSQTTDAKLTLNENVFGRQSSMPKWILSFVVFGLAAIVLLGTIFFAGENDTPHSPEKLKKMVNQTVEKNIIEQALTASVNAEAGFSQIDSAETDLTQKKLQRAKEDNQASQLSESSVEQAMLATDDEIVKKVSENELQANVVAEQKSILNDAEELEVSASFKSPKKIDTLTFSFLEECWLNVKEVEGNVIYSGTATAGSKLVLEGRGPFELMVGNAESASLLLNGEPVSIEPQRGRKTARLSVGG
ncbi:MAG: helix-turn-helix domain-containing protein [Cellvibrionaceae bacterium]